MEHVSLANTPEWRNVDLKTLREEIIARDRPAVMKGLVGHWPMIRASAQSPQALLEYVRERDLSHPIRVMVGQPEIKGLYFYRDDMTGLNFETAQRPFHAALASILAGRNQPNAPALYTGATPVEENFPQVGTENTLDVLRQHLGRSEEHTSELQSP